MVRIVADVYIPTIAFLRSNRERYEVVHAGVRTRMVALETQLAEANQVAEAVKAAEVDFLVGRLEEKDKELSRERAGAASIDHERHEVQQVGPLPPLSGPIRCAADVEFLCCK